MHRSVNVNDLVTKYRQVGQGEALLFLHGHRAETRKWLAFIQRLAQDFTVYAPELPGQNIHTPPFPDDVCTTERYAHFCAGFCEKLSLEKVVVVGVSFGGLIAVWLAKNSPDLVARQVLFWTPINGAHLVDPRVKRLRPFVARIARGGMWLWLWYVCLHSPIVRLFLKRDIKPEEYALEVIDHEIRQWHAVDLLTWSRSLIDIFDTRFSLEEQITTPTIAAFASRDRYFDVQKTLEGYKEIYPALKVFVIDSRFHVPKGNLTEEFVAEYEQVFRELSAY